jgi:hypothetical protein
MPRDARLLVRSTLAIAAGIALLLLGQTLIELGGVGRALTAAGTFSMDDARLLVPALARVSNQLLAVVFTAVAIAVPLTANTYSVKLLEIFISDRVNRAVLLTFAFNVINNVWLQHALSLGGVPRLQIGVSMVLAVVTPSLLLPYLYYVFRFLQPESLLARLQTELRREVERARARPAEAPARAAAAQALVEHVGSVAIRSVDRSDRTTAVEAAHALREVVTWYRGAKAGLPDGWWTAGKTVSGCDGHEAVIWLEARVFSELRSLLSAAIPKMHAAVAAVADDAAAIGLAARDDGEMDALVVDYFNTFVRLAINRKDVRSLFILFDRYRGYAVETVALRPERALEIGFYFQYYARASLDAGLPFAVETIAHDLAALVRRAWEARSPAREKLLERMLAFDREVSPKPLAGVKKALAILAGFYLLQGDEGAAERVAGAFRGLDRGFVDTLRDDIVHVRRERYWEVTDRRVNLDYVPADQREKVEAFFASVAAPARIAVEVAG